MVEGDTVLLGIDNISKRFGDTRAVVDLSLHIRQGEIVDELMEILKYR